MSIVVRRLLLVSCLLVSACSYLEPPPQVRGNKVDPESLKELSIGTSTKADVTAVIGSPTARATFDDNTWLYIMEMTQIRVGQTLGDVDQKVVILSFDGQGTLRDIQERGRDDGYQVSVISRTTPSPGTEASFLQQLLGNVGRFNATGAGGPRGGGGNPTPQATP